MRLRHSLPLIAVLALPPLLPAQSAAVRRAAASITPEDVTRRLWIIAHDSMGGRNTPSPGLTKTAEYIAAEFRRLGLKPGGPDGSFLMEYPIAQKRLLADRSALVFTGGDGGQTTSLSFATEVALAGRGLPMSSARAGIALLGGPGRFDSLPAAELRDRVILFLADWTQPGASTRLQQLSRFAASAGARGLVTVVNSDSAFQARYGSANARNYEVVGQPSGYFSVAVRESSILSRSPEAVGQLDAVRRAPRLVVQAVPQWEAQLSIADTTLSTAYAPNTVGILEGSDPTLKHEYMVYSAHMDHVGTTGQPGAGCGAMGGDSICNGADDDASGTVGVLELAEAFTRPGARPKRSVIFLTVSGEEHGLWGSDYFVRNPPVPLAQIVADLNADMIGRNWADTIVAIGKEHSDLGSTLNKVNAAHPEIRMTAIDDQWPEQSFYTRSDHYNFARRGVPILFFFNGTHVDYHRPSDQVEKIDAEKESRIVQLLFFVGQEVANAPQRPQWVPASYRTIVNP